MADMNDYAHSLRVVDVHMPGNETGYVTPPVLWNPAVKTPGIFGRSVAPTLGKVLHWFDHGTVGSNTLRHWCTGGSCNDAAGWSLAQYLVPRDWTVYADGIPHDTRNVLFKMCPDGRGCNHTGRCITPFDNTNSLGVEYESLQNGTHDITDMQYIKGALLYANAAARHQIKDYFRVAHGLVAIPWGRRTDPWAGKFDIARSWELVQEIRRDPRIWEYWGMTQPTRGY